LEETGAAHIIHHSTEGVIMAAKSSLITSVFATMLLWHGAVSAQWTAAGSGLPGANDLSYIVAVPGQDKVIAGVRRGGLHATTNGGSSWSRLGTAAGSDPVDNTPNQIVFDPEDSDIFWECGMYGSAVCKTTDGGQTFTHLGDVTHNDGLSIDFSDPQRRTIIVGGHEQKRKLQKTTDGGQTWTNIGANLPATSHFSSYPLILDTDTYIVGCSGWGDGEEGIWRTTDGGNSWTKVAAQGAANPPMVDSDGYIYYALIWDRGLIKGTPDGTRWATAQGWGTMRTVAPVELPDGSIIASSYTSNGLIRSFNSGVAWESVQPATPGEVLRYTYSDVRQELFVATSAGVYRMSYPMATAANPTAGVTPSRALTSTSPRAVIAGLSGSSRLHGNKAAAFSITGRRISAATAVPQVLLLQAGSTY
jgi:photosystem II stability/assembly factor-like uncharacterized protein